MNLSCKLKYKINGNKLVDYIVQNGTILYRRIKKNNDNVTISIEFDDQHVELPYDGILNGKLTIKNNSGSDVIISGIETIYVDENNYEWIDD